MADLSGCGEGVRVCDVRQLSLAAFSSPSPADAIGTLKVAVRSRTVVYLDYAYYINILEDAYGCSVFASLFKLIVCTSNVLTKLVLPPTLFPDKAWCRALDLHIVFHCVLDPIITCSILISLNNGFTNNL